MGVCLLGFAVCPGEGEVASQAIESGLSAPCMAIFLKLRRRQYAVVRRDGATPYEALGGLLYVGEIGCVRAWWVPCGSVPVEEVEGVGRQPGGHAFLPEQVFGQYLAFVHEFLDVVGA